MKDFNGYRYDVFLTKAAAVRVFNKYCSKTRQHDPVPLEPEIYFAVDRGRTLRVHSSWNKAKAQIRDYEGHRYGIFQTRIEAFRALESHCARSGNVGGALLPFRTSESSNSCLFNRESRQAL